jgi:hypothetical protein
MRLPGRINHAMAQPRASALPGISIDDRRWNVMLDITTIVITIVLLVELSRRANRRWSDEPYLPMQWSLDGRVNWSAPRPLALAFMPVLATVCLIGIGALLLFATPGHHQGDVGSATLALCATGLVCIHLLHMWLIGKTIARRNG